MPSTKKTTKNPDPQPQPETAMFEPASAPVDPATTSEVPVVTVPAAATEPDPAPAIVAQPSAAPERLRFGQVEGLLHRLPLGAVLVHLEAFEDRIATLKDSQAILDLQPQMRATEGRCAPVYFIADGFTSPWHLISGIEGIAAAITLGMECVFVVTVRPADAGAIQSYAVSAATVGPVETEDDFLMRVNAYHSE